MLEKVKQYMDKFHMVSSGDDIIVGLSGGVDSVCLLFLLHNLSEELEFSLRAVHINHGLREESKEEEVFVKELCRKLDIPCEVHRIDVNTYAGKMHLGKEEAARILRYQIFEDCAGKAAGKIALAQHQNDQAETVLFHLFRGTGIRGLTGIQPVRGQYIRPLLDVTREEIEIYAKENGLEYVTDNSNFDTIYARNKIRHEILPKAEEINQGATTHIAAEAAMVKDAMDFLDSLLEEAYEKWVTELRNPDGELRSCTIEKQRLKEQHAYLKAALVYEMLARVGGRKKDISRAHVGSALGLLDGQSGRQVDLIYGLQAVTEQKQFVIQKKLKKEKNRINEWQQKLNIREITSVGDISVSCRVFSYEKSQVIPIKPYTKWFDYDKIINCPVIRNRRSGDYFYCSDTAKKKLQDYFVNEKIALSEREAILLIADGEHIMWIVGGRISNYYKVTDETKQILEITINKGESSER